MMPNMNVATNGRETYVTVFYDLSAKIYGLRKSARIIHNGVHIEATKNITMTKEELIDLYKKMGDFIKKDRE